MFSRILYLLFIGNAFTLNRGQTLSLDGDGGPQPRDRGLLSPLLQFHVNERFLRELENTSPITDTPPSFSSRLRNFNRSFDYRPFRNAVEDALLPEYIGARLPPEHDFNARFSHLIPREAVEDVATPQTSERIQRATNPLWSESPINNHNIRFSHRFIREPVEDNVSHNIHEDIESMNIQSGNDAISMPPLFNPYARGLYNIRREAVENSAFSQAQETVVTSSRRTFSLLWPSPPTSDSITFVQREPVEDTAIPNNLQFIETVPVPTGDNGPILVRQSSYRLEREAVEDHIPTPNILSLVHVAENNPAPIDGARLPIQFRREAVEDERIPADLRNSNQINFVPPNNYTRSANMQSSQNWSNIAESQLLGRILSLTRVQGWIIRL